MRVFARRIKHPLDVSVQCPHHTNARHHGRAVELDDQEQGFYRSLPFLKILLGLGKPLDIGRGVLEGDELATAGQGNWIVEGALPISRHDAARTDRRPRRDDRTRCRAFAVADVHLRVVMTVRIAAIDEHMFSAVASHVGQPHGLIVKHQVRDRPGHRPIKARSEQIGNQ